MTQSGPMKVRPWGFSGTVGKVKLSMGADKLVKYQSGAAGGLLITTLGELA